MQNHDLRDNRDLERAEKASGALLAFGKEGRERRLNADYTGQTILSSRAYNGVLIGTVVWGLGLAALLCALVGNIYDYINPLLFIVLYLALGIGGIVLAQKSSNPWVSFIGFNMLALPMGLLVSTLVTEYLEAPQLADVVWQALLYTALITVGMLGTAMVFPNFFSKLSGILGGVLIGLVLCELVLLIFGVRQQVTDWIAAGLFSLYIGYDVWRSQQFEKTADNAVDCALDLYMDIINLFIRLLRILAKSKD